MAYTKVITQTLMVQAVQNWTSAIERRHLDRIFEALDTEFTAIETAGAGAYARTATFDALVREAVRLSIENVVRIEALLDFFNLVIAEIAAVDTAADVPTYSQTSGFLSSLREKLLNIPNTEERQAMDALAVLLDTEFALVDAQ